MHGRAEAFAFPFANREGCAIGAEGKPLRICIGDYSEKRAGFTVEDINAWVVSTSREPIAIIGKRQPDPRSRGESDRRKRMAGFDVVNDDALPVGDRYSRAIAGELQGWPIASRINRTDRASVTGSDNFRFGLTRGSPPSVWTDEKIGTGCLGDPP
jgi:hypothetical protein